VFVLAALLLLLAAVAIFASQNAHMVAVNLLGWHFSWPLAGVVLITLVAGALVAFLIGVVRQLRLRLKMYDTSGRLRKTENELSAAKAELEKAKVESEKNKAALAEKEQHLVAVRVELAAAQRELEEARRQARVSGHAQAGAEGNGAKGGGPGGPGRGRA